MYSEVFCKVYNEFGWNYYPEAFGEQLLQWLDRQGLHIRSSLDLACGTGVLCGILHSRGIRAMGVDLSEGMIRVARENFPEISFRVADMVRFRMEAAFDLVTCTGDSLNHILSREDLGAIFRNVYASLQPGGVFLFDLLKESEISTDEPFDLDFSDTIRARFQMLRTPEGLVNLKTRVYENGEFRFEENIYETLHDCGMVCRMLRDAGFRSVQVTDRIPEDSGQPSSTCYIIARK